MQTQRVNMPKVEGRSALPLKVLSQSQVKRIDDMLSELGAFGELRLIKRKGQLRFIEKVESFDLADEA